MEAGVRRLSVQRGVVNVLVVSAVVLAVLLAGLWLALLTGLVESEGRPNWSCVNSNMAGAPPPCAYPNSQKLLHRAAE